MQKVNIALICFSIGLSLYSGASIAEKFGSVKNATGLPEYVKEHLVYFARQSSSKQIVVSSKFRTPEKQAEVMIDYYIECNKGLRPLRKLPCNLQTAVAIYGKECQPPIRVYSKARTRSENIRHMGAAINKNLIAIGHHRTCMTHVKIEGVELDRVTVDVKPSSVNDRVKFYDAVMEKMQSGDVVRFFYPNMEGRPPSTSFDSAFHIEFKKHKTLLKKPAIGQ